MVILKGNTFLKVAHIKKFQGKMAFVIKADYPSFWNLMDVLLELTYILAFLHWDPEEEYWNPNMFQARILWQTHLESCMR